jgi:hypothetical protein
MASTAFYRELLAFISLAAGVFYFGREVIGCFFLEVSDSELFFYGLTFY